MGTIAKSIYAKSHNKYMRQKVNMDTYLTMENEDFFCAAKVGTFGLRKDNIKNVGIITVKRYANCSGMLRMQARRLVK
jgi:hypothetical protein